VFKWAAHVNGACLDFQGNAFLNLDSLKFDFPNCPNPFNQLAQIKNCSDIIVQNCEAVGRQADNWYGYGIYFDTCARVTAKWNYTHHMSQHISFFASTDCLAEHNKMEYAVAQGHFKVNGSQRVILRRNGMIWLDIAPGAHCECIQIFNSGAAFANDDILVEDVFGYEGNISTAGTSAMITSTDNRGGTLNSNNVRFINNVVYAASLTAFGMQHNTNVVMTGNLAYFVARTGTTGTGGAWPNATRNQIEGCSGTEGGNGDSSGDVANYDYLTIGGMVHSAGCLLLPEKSHAEALAAYAAYMTRIGW
jgi:hypothetical protein